MKLPRQSGMYSRKASSASPCASWGHAVRTGFLLDYLSDIELRRKIKATINRSKRFKQVLKWVPFAVGTRAFKGIHDEQQVFIKDNHLVANLLLFQNVVTMGKALERLITKGWGGDLDLNPCSSPYLKGYFDASDAATLIGKGCGNHPTVFYLQDAPERAKSNLRTTLDRVCFNRMLVTLGA